MLKPGVSAGLAGLAALAALAACSTEVVETGPEVAEPAGVVRVRPEATPVPGGGSGPAAFAIGDCLTWDQGAPTAVFEAVACTDPHLAEVAGVLDLSEVYPPDASLPSTEERVAEGAAACPEVVAAYLGREPGDDLEEGVVPPSDADWEAGGRTWFCTVGFARVDGRRPAYTGRLVQGDAERA